MKKIILSILSIALAGIVHAQDATSPRVPPIRMERKEFKQEHQANREMRLEMRIRQDRRELRHMRNGRQHDWRHNGPRRPMGRPGMHRRPMMDRRYR